MENYRIPLSLIVSFCAWVSIGITPCLSATFTVTSNANGVQSDGVSLRWAITQANNSPGRDTILFNIPGMAPHQIQLSSALPSISDDMAIDASSQPANGYMGNEHKIVLDGGSLTGNGLHYEDSVSTSSYYDVFRIEGLSLRNFSGYGIFANESLDSLIVSDSDISNVKTGVKYIPSSYYDYLEIESCHIHHCDSIGVDFDGDSFFVVSQSSIRNSLIDSCGWAGIKLASFLSGSELINSEVAFCDSFGVFLNGEGSTGQRDYTISGCNIRHCGTGILVYPDDNLLIENNSITDNLFGCVLGASGTQSIINQVFFRNNDFLRNHRAIYGPNLLSYFSSTGDHMALNGVGYYLYGPSYIDIDSSIVGLDSLGMFPSPNDTGIYIINDGYSFGDLIQNSIVSGNNGYGILYANSSPLPYWGGVDITLLNNFVGTDGSGTINLGNGSDGIRIQLRDSLVHNFEASQNVISGNGGNGFVLDLDNISPINSSFHSNKIGTDITGLQPIPNDSNGIVILGNSTFLGDSTKGANVIAFNKGNGITVHGKFNTIRFNEFLCNQGEAIVLVGQGNDNFQPPSIQGYDSLGALGLALPGTLVDIYEKDSCACGFSGQGRFLIGTAVADSLGEWTFSGTLPAQITVKGTDPLSGNTSGFSACCTGPPTALFSANPIGGQSFDFVNVSIPNADTSQVSWWWDFGDGDTATIFEPTHTYAQAGNYQTCLVIKNPCGTDSLCNQLLVTGKETAIGLKAEVYPNPSSGKYILSLPGSGGNEAEIWVYQLEGKMLLHQTHLVQANDGIELDLSDRPSGSYWLRVRSGEKEVTMILGRN